MLATDGSENAKRATRKALELAKRMNAVVVAFNSVEHHMIPRTLPVMIPFAPVGSYSVPQMDYSRIRDEYRIQGAAVLKNVEEVFGAQQVPIETRLIEEETPEEYVQNTVKEEGFDLVILGCSGHHSKLRRALMGTVANKVLNEADCDVMVVR